MVVSVGSLMPSVMQSHMGFIVTSFTWYVMGQVMQSIEGLKTSWLWLSNTYFMDTLTISIYPPPPPLSPCPTPLPPSPQQTEQMFIQSFSLNEWFVTLSTCGATSLQYELANECWCFQSARMPFCILCNCVDSLHCDGVCAYSNSQLFCITFHAGHTVEASPHCKWVNEFSDVHNTEQFFALSASVWPFLDCGRSSIMCVFIFAS